MGDADLRLQRLKTEIKCLVMAFSEPSSSLKINKEYKEMFDSTINYKQFGYSCLESLLKDCSDLQFINAGGQVLFKAKLTKETESLQKMISAQKKKKKKKTNTAKPSFHRASRAYRSFAPSSKPSSQYSFNRMSFRGTGTFERRVPVVVPHTPIKSDGVLGMSRFLRIMKNYEGKVTLRKFQETYLSMYGVPLDKREMESLFGLPNLAAVHDKFLQDKINIITLPSGYMLISKDNIMKRKIWEQTHTFEIVSNNPVKWDKPSLATLYKNVVHLLKEMYPETINVEEASEIYKRFYSVQVDPMALYAKTWEQLTMGVFKEKLRLIHNSISLQEDVVVTEKLRAPSTIPSCQQSTCTSVSDIMMDSSDDDEDEDYQNGPDSEVESVASYFTTSNTDKCSDNENDEKESTLGFGFGRVSSLRKSRTIKKSETNKVVEKLSDSNQATDLDIAGLQITDTAEQQPKKGRGFGFKSFAKSLISKISDKEKEKEKTNTRKVSDSSSYSIQIKDDEVASSDGSSYYNGYQVKFVGDKYNNAAVERALSHHIKNPLNASTR